MATHVEGWRFKTGQPGRWIWQQVAPGGEVLSTSGGDFGTIEECAVDAQRCGYAGVIADYAEPIPIAS